MSLNDIRLFPTLAAQLYRSSLIEAGDIEPRHEKQRPGIKEIIKEEAIASPTWKYLGSNEKNILIVVNYKNTTHLPDEELSFLTSILSACKLTLGDVAIVNMNNYSNHNYKDLTGHFNSRIALMFGVEPISFGLPIDFPHFQVQSFSNHIFLYSPAMEERHHDQLFKSKLWVSLRRVFSI